MKVVVAIGMFMMSCFTYDIRADDVINNGVMMEQNHGTVNIRHKGSNYLEENLNSAVKKISKSYENYDIQLEGKVNISKKFRPFRINIDGIDDNIGGWTYKKTLNIKKPFYKINTNVSDMTHNSRVIHSICTNEKCNKAGFNFIVEITNITDFGEDIIFSNKFLSSIIREGDANHVLLGVSSGGEGEYIKINKSIQIKEGIQKFKFKKSDYLTLRPGETIILSIEYIARKTGVYVPYLILDMKYAGAKGKLKIRLNELIVPKLIGDMDFLYDESLTLNDATKVKINENGVHNIEWYLYDELTYKMENFNFSSRKLLKSELIFIGKERCRIFRNELFARKGAIFKSKWLTKYFKLAYGDKYNPQIEINEILPSQFTDIEKYNIRLALEVEKELIEKEKKKVRL